MRLTTTGIAFLGLAAIFALVPVHAQQEQPNCTPGRDLVTIKVLDASICTQLANCPAEIKDYTTCGENKDTKKEECTVTIPGYFKMRSDFADFTGMFVNHCHILAHEDRGMMQLIQVIDKPKNYYDHH